MSQAVPLDPPRRLLDLEIDGRTTRVPEGATILDACRAEGVDTPTMCYAGNLTPVNACRVCMVEVEGSRVLVPRCHAGPAGREHEPRLLRLAPMDGGVRSGSVALRGPDGADGER